MSWQDIVKPTWSPACATASKSPRTSRGMRPACDASPPALSPATEIAATPAADAWGLGGGSVGVAGGAAAKSASTPFRASACICAGERLPSTVCVFPLAVCSARGEGRVGRCSCGASPPPCAPHLPVREDAAVEPREDGAEDGFADRRVHLLLLHVGREDAVEGEALRAAGGRVEGCGSGGGGFGGQQEGRERRQDREARGAGDGRDAADLEGGGGGEW